MEQPVVAEALRTDLVPYLTDRGFSEVTEDAHSVVYESATTQVSVYWDPRGEIAVVVARLDEQSPHGRWQYGEITTATGVPVHLRKIIREFTEQPALLAGDPAFFDALRETNEQRSRELTAYYSRKGPRPEWLDHYRE